MRNLILFLIFLGVAGYSAKFLFSSFGYSNGSLQLKSYSYPDKIVIENKEGSEIQITLLGRSSMYLEFNQQDGRKFIYPIRSLSEKSQELVMKYPENGIKDASAQLSNGGIEMNDVYIIQMEAEISKIEAEIARLKMKASATGSKTEARTLEREIDELREEIADLKDKIARRQ
jgi:peptidoglycan hydrolase CwlO-like protein